MSIVGLVLGIISLLGGIIGTTLLFSTVVGIICIVLGVAGIVLSVLGRKSGQNVGAGTAGLVVSILGIVFSIIFTAACACTHKVGDEVVNAIGQGGMQEIESALSEAATAAGTDVEGIVDDAIAAVEEAATEAK